MRKLIWFIWCLSLASTAQDATTLQSDVKAPFEHVRTTVDALSKEMAFGELVAQAAKQFLDKPYLAHTLEADGPEALVLRFDGFDCWTLMETSTAMARCVQSGGTFKDFQGVLQNMRYRDGQITGYASRLHYTIDWAFNGVQQGKLVDLTQSLGGVKRSKRIAFMTENAKLYAGLSDPAQLAQMKAVEEAINQRAHYVIPSDHFASIEDEVHDGDLLAVATDISLLDVQHVGIAIHHQGRVHLLHASSKAGRVVISDEPFADWLRTSKRAEGAMVFRPLP